MQEVVLIIHLILALAIVGLVLLQRSEGGGLGIGGQSGGMGNFATAQSTGNALTKITTLCAILFFCTSLTLGILANQKSSADKIFEQAGAENSSGEVIEKEEVPVEIPVAPISE